MIDSHILPHLIQAYEPGAEFRTSGDRLEFWSPTNTKPQPTRAELELLESQVRAEMAAKQQAAASLKAAREAMAAKFDSLPVGTRAAFYGVRVAAEGALDKGDVTAARLLVEQAQVTPELEAIKAEILALFPQS